MCISYLSFSVKSPQSTATRLLSEASALTFLLDDNVTKVNPGHVWPSLGAVWYADKLSILPVPRAYLKEPRSQIPAMLCKIHHAFSISSHPEVLHGLCFPLSFSFLIISCFILLVSGFTLSPLFLILKPRNQLIRYPRDQISKMRSPERGGRGGRWTGKEKASVLGSGGFKDFGVRLGMFK